MTKNVDEFQIITARYYRIIFGCSYGTAKSWYKQDLEMLQRRRLTVAQFNVLYGTCEPLTNATNEAKKG